MLDESVAVRYFKALSSRDGALASSLFAPDGCIDDFRGRRHAGRDAIEAFIDQVPQLELEFLSDFLLEADGICAYGNIHYPGKEPLLLRWVFIASGSLIGHLVNSRIETVPLDRRRNTERGAA